MQLFVWLTLCQDRDTCWACLGRVHSILPPMYESQVVSKVQLWQSFELRGLEDSGTTFLHQRRSCLAASSCPQEMRPATPQENLYMCLHTTVLLDGTAVQARLQVSSSPIHSLDACTFFPTEKQSREVSPKLLERFSLVLDWTFKEDVDLKSTHIQCTEHLHKLKETH